MNKACLFCCGCKVKNRFLFFFLNECKIVIISYPSILTYVLGSQKNHLIETVLLSTHNICFG